MSDELDPYAQGTDPLTIEADLDGDGVPDTAFVDAALDGDAEGIVTQDEEGAITTEVDTDNSGTMDTAYLDQDGDGAPEMQVTDTDGNGTPDQAAVDTDGDGTFDHVELVDGTPVDGEDGTPASPIDPSDPVNSPLLDDDPSNDDGAAPADDPDDAVHGDAEYEAQFYRTQTQNGFCVPVSVGMVMYEMTGVEPSEADLVDRSQDLNLMAYDGEGNYQGLTVEGGVELLESDGIDAHYETGTINELETMLDQGRDVIMWVDSDEVCYPATDDDSVSDQGVDHALVLTSIDESTGIAYLNDPGNPDGEAYPISIPDLRDAWNDGHNLRVVTDEVPAAPGSPSTPGALPDTDSGVDLRPYGFVLVPVVWTLLRSGVLTPKRAGGIKTT